MSEIKNIRDQFISKLENDLSIDQINEIKTGLFGKNGLISSSLVPVKVLGNGTLDKAMNITASSFSDSAIKKIEESGGKATIQ